MLARRPGERFYTDPRLQFGALTAAPLPERQTPIRLSIALVTRNRPEWLRRSLASWRAQPIQPFEIIVSDDSDDPVREQNQEIAKDFDCMWVPGPRRGLYANRNHAFLAGTGTHVMSADDDHTHPNRFVEEVLAGIGADPEAIWTVGERAADRPGSTSSIPGELRADGTIGPAALADASAAIACGSTVYPRKVFEHGLRYPETYRFGGLWYLWGHRLRRAGFRIRHLESTFVWHDATSSRDRDANRQWVEAQHECNLYVQAAHAFWISGTLRALCRAFYHAIKLLAAGEAIGGERKIRLGTRGVVRAFTRAIRTPSV
jgi:glycosyltransferase involved in cell wall biosynthesis